MSDSAQRRCREYEWVAQGSQADGRASASAHLPDYYADARQGCAAVIRRLGRPVPRLYGVPSNLPFPERRIAPSRAGQIDPESRTRISPTGVATEAKTRARE